MHILLTEKCTNKKISKEIKERGINQLDKLNLIFFNSKGMFGNIEREYYHIIYE